MSYCVNCGVELEKSQQHCPLCGVEVINPKAPYDPAAPRPYSSRVAAIQKRVGRRYAAIVATVVVCLACAICIMADLVYGETQSITWSAYAVGGLLLGWLLVLFPLCCPQLHPAAYALLDVCGVLLFLYVINSMDASGDWYMAVAVPQVVLYGMLAVLDIIAWRSKRVNGLEKVAWVVASVGVGLMGLEIVLDLYNDMAVALDWSWFAIIPAFAVALILVIVERKRELKDEIFRRLRV